ncbi:MAG: hypothetical protein WA049_19405 [Ferribacterium limneticum]
MKRPVSATHYPPEDMQALRQLIAQLAPQCGVDLGNRTSIRQFLDSDPGTGRSESIDPQICQELRIMMILLYRLEASSSEDLGVEGLRRLWRQHDEIMTRFQA